MADKFANAHGGLTGPGTYAEEADYSSGDHTFSTTLITS